MNNTRIAVTKIEAVTGPGFGQDLETILFYTASFTISRAGIAFYGSMNIGNTIEKAEEIIMEKLKFLLCCPSA